MSRCEGCPCFYLFGRQGEPYCAALDAKPRGYCHLTPSDMWAIKSRISGECDRLAPMKGCEHCQGSGEEWNPEARFGLSKCSCCNGHGDNEFWGDEEND